MNNPPIWDEAIHAVEHGAASAWQHLAHHHPAVPTELTHTEAPVAETLADAIRGEAHAALADILDRYLTPANLAHALADALDTPATPANPVVTQPTPPAIAAAVQPGDPDAPEPEPAA